MSNNANNFNIIITNLKNGVYIKASATVEAALVMPLYIYAVMAVTYDADLSNKIGSRCCFI